MTFQNYAFVWNIDQCYSLSKTNQSNGLDRLNLISWVDLRPMYINETNLKNAKVDHRLNLMQENKAEFFFEILKLNAQKGYQ